MPTDALHVWLKRKTAKRIAGCGLGAVLALAGGAGVLFLTFWLAYAILWVGESGVSAFIDLAFDHKARLTHGWRLAICGLFILALLIERFRRSEWELGNYGPTKGGALTNALVFRTGSVGGLIVLLANPQASATMITEILYTGPRLVLGAWQLASTAWRLLRVELPTCVWVLECLMRRDQAVTNEELGAVWPDADWQKIRADLAYIPGVLLLEKGLALTSDLREELLRSSESQTESNHASL
jgi:hypothetical protein